MAAAEEPEERSRAAGGCVLVVFAGAGFAGVWAASSTAGVLTVWLAGIGLVWWSVRRTANPAPPPPPERGSDANPQFTVIEDRPGHCTITWHEEVTD